MRLADPADLPPRWLEHPFIRTEYPHAEIFAAWTYPGPQSHAPTSVVLWIEDTLRGEGREIVGLGEPSQLAELFSAAVTDLPASGDELPWQGGSVQRGTVDLLTQPVRAALGIDSEQGVAAWDLMFSEHALSADQSVPLDSVRTEEPSAALAAEIRTFLAVAYPRAYTDPADPSIFAWWTVREDTGELVGAIGATQFRQDSPVMLCSLGVADSARGRKLGSALLVTAINDGLERTSNASALVALGVYADNSRARGLYERLGIRNGGEFESW